MTNAVLHNKVAYIYTMPVEDKFFMWYNNINSKIIAELLNYIRNEAARIKNRSASFFSKKLEKEKIMYYKEWLRDWLEHYMKPSTKDKTFTRYEQIVNQHLIPKLGDYEINELTPILVQRYISELLNSGNLKTGKGLAPNSVNSIIAVLQNSLGTAHILGIADKYEMDKLKRPKAKEKQVTCFTPSEQKQIEQAAMLDKRIKMRGIVLCLYSGVRIGELLALEWSDIDFNSGELSVNKNCHDGKDKGGRLIRITDTPKTATSKRVIPLPKPILQMLKEMKKNSSSPYVVSGGDTVLSIRSYQRSFELLLVKLKIPHRGFHSLRHTFATRALECGMDVKTLSEILGHKSATVTLNRYAHSLMEHKRDMMNRLGKLLYFFAFFCHLLL